MKLKKLLLLSIVIFVLSSCENPFFPKLDYSQKLVAPSVHYDSDGYLRWDYVTGATEYEICHSFSSSSIEDMSYAAITSYTAYSVSESYYGGW